MAKGAMSIEFGRPEFLYLLLLVPVWFLLAWPGPGSGLVFARGEFAGRLSRWSATHRLFLPAFPRLLRAGSLACLIVALADPYRIVTHEETELRRGGLVIALDISTSMLAADMSDERSRLVLAQSAAASFARGRTLDDLSLVTFAGEAATFVPATRDRELVVEGIESLQVRLLLDGTNLSSAMMVSMKRLREMPGAPRVLVLLTDGAHNVFGITPLATARIAEALDIRVHSIALVGVMDDEPANLGAVMRRQQIAAETEEMESVLRGISRITGGQYFRASDAAGLDSIFRQIHELEAPIQELVQIETMNRLFSWPLLLGLLLFSAEIALRGSRWGVVP